MIDLNEMVVFARVVEAGSFTAAAEALGLPKSTVSRRVASLEERLGARLLHRTTRRLRLTEEGAAYYERCARIAAEAQDADRAVSQMQSEPRGVLRVSAPRPAAPILADIVGQLIDTFPKVEVDVVLSDEVLDFIDDGIDVAIRVGRLPDSSLYARRIGPAHRVYCASPGYIARRGRPKHPVDLAEHECVVMVLGDATPATSNHWHFEGPDGRFDVPVSGRLRVNSIEMARVLALQGRGVTMLPLMAAVEHLRAGHLETVLDAFLPTGEAVYAVYPSKRHAPAALRAFIDLLVETLSDGRLVANYPAGSPSVGSAASAG
jgi:DNA-binding transcriptional LysR family regulator